MLFVFVTAYHSSLSVLAVYLEIGQSVSLVIFVFLMCLFHFSLGLVFESQVLLQDDGLLLLGQVLG